MRRFALSCCCAAVLAGAAPAAAQTGPCASTTGRSVSVRGAASLRVKPDTVAFTVGVETQGPSVREIFAANAKKVEAMIAALKAKGVTPEQIQTSNLDVGTTMNNEGRPTGFRVSNLVTVTRPDPASAAELLQSALEAGANDVGGLQFSVSDPGQLAHQGLEAAFRDARTKAEALAGFSGRALGDVVCVSEESGGGGPRPLQMAREAAVSIEPGTEQLQFAVSVVFELR
jgi:uncharacterized protein